MKETLGIFAVVFLVALLLALVLFNFWGGHKPKRCVALAALLGGTTGWIYAEIMSSLRWGWKLGNETRFSSSNWAINTVFILLNVLFLSLIAFIPSLFMGYLHRRLGRKTHEEN